MNTLIFSCCPSSIHSIKSSRCWGWVKWGCDGPISVEWTNLYAQHPTKRHWIIRACTTIHSLGSALISLDNWSYSGIPSELRPITWDTSFLARTLSTTSPRAITSPNFCILKCRPMVSSSDMVGHGRDSASYLLELQAYSPINLFWLPVVHLGGRRQFTGQAN